MEHIERVGSRMTPPDWPCRRRPRRRLGAWVERRRLFSRGKGKERIVFYFVKEMEGQKDWPWNSQSRGWRRRAAVEQGALQFEIAAAELLNFASISLAIIEKDCIFLIKM